MRADGAVASGRSGWRVRATPKKGEKVALLADLLRETEGRETALCALYLTGTLPQGKIGLGWRTIQAATSDTPASGPPLALLDVDRAFDAIAADAGAGSTERRVHALRTLFERTDAAGRRFLGELVVGEVRQGALDGLVRDAI